METTVLILVVVEDGLVRAEDKVLTSQQIGLNPCCSGRWSRTEICCFRSLFP